MFGRRFQTEKQGGDHPSFRDNFVVELPVHASEEALAQYDEEEIVFEVFEYDREPDNCRVAWTCMIPIWKLLAPEGNVAKQAIRATANAFEEVTETIGIKKHHKEEITCSLEQSLQNKQATGNDKLFMVSPSHSGNLIVFNGYIEIEAQAAVQTGAPREKKCVSPELIGCGSLCNLFSSHRACWFDSNLGVAKFNPDHAANFVEFRLSELVFPKAATEADQKQVWQYMIRVKSNGVTVSSVPLHRPRAAWSTALKEASAMKISFEGCKLSAPLAPGRWSSGEEPQVEIEIVRCHESPGKSYTLQTFLNASSPASHQAASNQVEKLFHGFINLKDLAVDQPRSKENLYLSRASHDPCMNVVATSQASQSTDPACVVTDVCLRDRDYVKVDSASAADESNALGGSVLCIGDRAMLCVEETLVYPHSQEEFRRSCFPPNFEYEAERQTGPWQAPLRDPSMSHEFAGFEQKATSRAKYIPMSCEDFVPAKFMLPRSETQHLLEERPGIYWRLVEQVLVDKAQAPAQEGAHADANGRLDAKKAAIVVDKLSHLVKKVPCTLLAVYTNGMCDLELAPTFIHEWHKAPHKMLSIPGHVQVREFKDASLAAVRSFPTGMGDVGELVRRRVVLSGVPLNMVMAVQAGSFNIYDAAFGTSDDVAKVHPAVNGNDFNPRHSSDDQMFFDGRKGAYRIAAGPVPVDVTSAQHEWKLHLHAHTDDDMYNFVTVLRQCVRQDLANQVKKMRQYKAQSSKKAATRSYTTGATLTTHSGNLEVVLVEARNLRESQVMPQSKDWKHHAWKNVRRELNPFATFTLRNGNEPLVYRGSTVQTSMTIGKTSEQSWSWGAQDEMKSVGGWSFKTPSIEPSEHNDLVFELELKHHGLYGQPELVGSVVVGCTNDAGDEGVPKNPLCSTKEPFPQLVAALIHDGFSIWQANSESIWRGPFAGPLGSENADWRF
jgi:hypothetical protein